MTAWLEAWNRTFEARSQIEEWRREDAPPASVRTLNSWDVKVIEIRRLLIAAEYGWISAIDAMGIPIDTILKDHPNLNPGAMEAPHRAEKLLKELESSIKAARKRAVSRAKT